MNRLYEKNKEKELSDALFQNPTKEYRGAPFWAWNTRPDKEVMKAQMDAFSKMGFGGFHIHSRTGLDVPYLGEEFMEDVRFCVEYAKEHDMLAWAYDEDRFPSGFAGGLVTKDKKYRYRELLWTPKELEGADLVRPKQRAVQTYLIGIYDVELDENGCLKQYHIVQDAAKARHGVWYAYLRVAAEDSWFNNQTYVDTLDKASIERFCEVTHERYKEVVGEYFGTVIPSFFTDEPKTTYKKTLSFASDRKNLIMPWTDDLPDTFWNAYKEDLVGHLPELFWQLPGGEVSKVRYLYHRHVAERFTESYSRTISDWCESNNVRLTGHMIKEPSLSSQSTAVGETMAPLAPFGFPGIDMLCDEREYTTAKQAQSIAHQFGREAMLSELYGVTNWDFDFRGHKTAGDWQAALGVSIRVPHLSWMTMEGEAKRDYPASIQYQSPWYEEYALIEDHFARLNVAMTRGKAKVRIGVIHPVESYWCYWGPQEHTAAIRKQIDENFQQLTEWLLFEHYDFDFISESVLADMYEAADGKLHVGESTYEVVLVPGCKTLRETTLKALKQLAKSGGQVIFAGELPQLVEGEPSKKVKKALEKYAENDRMMQIPFDKCTIIDHLRPYQEVKIVDFNGNTCNKHIYQLRTDGENQWLLLVYAKKKARYDCEGVSRMRIIVRGLWYPVLYDTVTGEIRPCNYRHGGDSTIIEQSYSVQDSILLHLQKRPRAFDVEETQPVAHTAAYLTDLDHIPYHLSEPNVAVLDRACYQVTEADEMPDEEAYQGPEEVLRIGQSMRSQYGYTPQGGRMAQPWTSNKPPKTKKLHLRFAIESQIPVSGAKLALEQAETAQLRLNGTPVEAVVDGWYTDRSIQTVALPDLQAGVNLLDIALPFGEGANVENAFLLGDFGVTVHGSTYELTALPQTVSFGSLTEQGFPFYGGNFSYDLQVSVPDGELSVHASYFRGALIGVSLDGVRKGSIAFAPYTFEARDLTPGEHTLTLTLFGTRINTFGTLHNCNENTTWFGPDAWRTNGDGYSEEYQLKRTGILKRPAL